MKPILYQCGFFTIYTYGVFVAIAFLVSTLLLIKEAEQRHMDGNRIYQACLIILIGGIISARLFYIILNWDYFKINLFETFMLSHGGLVWFGGLFGALVCGLIFFKRRKIPLLSTLDLFALYVALAQAIGRIGCFFNGCCYGRKSLWGIYFPVHGRILFPSQLLDSLTLLLIFVILRLVTHGHRQGIVFALYLMLASLQRFLMEFIRGDLRPFYYSLSIFQWMSIGLFFLGLIFYIIFLWKPRPQS